MITVDNTSIGSFGTGTTRTWSHTCAGSDRALFVLTRGGDGQGDRITGITYNGAAMTKIASVVVPGGSTTLSLYYLANPSAGTYDVTITMTSGYIEGCSSSYNGVNTSSLIDVNTTNTATAASIATSLTTTTDNCWTIIACRSSSGSVTAGTGSTQRVKVNSTLYTGIFDSNAAITPPGLTSMTINNAGSGGIGVVMAAFKVPSLDDGNTLTLLGV